MIEAAWLKLIEGGNSQVWARCASCHANTLILSNAKPMPAGMPFCTCSKCGEFLYDDEKKAAFVAAISAKGWHGGLTFLRSIEFKREE